MLKLDLASIPQRKGSSYPAPFHREPAERVRQALGDAGGLTQFGVNLLQLPPGAWSSQRQWHSSEDEFVYMIAGEEVLRAGDCVAFPKNTAIDRHLVNRSGTIAVCLEIGTRSTHSVTDYPDIDLMFDPTIHRYTHKDGALYPSE